MRLDDLYSWVTFVHVAAVLGFLLAHGASAAVTCKLRGERDRTRVQSLLELSNA